MGATGGEVVDDESDILGKMSNDQNKWKSIHYIYIVHPRHDLVRVLKLPPERGCSNPPFRKCFASQIENKVSVQSKFKEARDPGKATKTRARGLVVRCH